MRKPRWNGLSPTVQFPWLLGLAMDWIGGACHGMARRILTCHGFTCHGITWRGLTWHGMEWSSMPWHGLSCRGLTWRSLTWLVVLALLAKMTGGCEYAHIDPRHTMCTYDSKACHGRKLIRSWNINCMEKQTILEGHNRVRQMLAHGKIKGQPAALNMRELVWDDELARIAQRWADQCMPGHDHKRNTDRFAVGQNVAATWTFGREARIKDAPEYNRHIKAWFDEVYKFGFKTRDIDPFKFRMNVGHYTQLAWADTYMVGCGYTYYDDPKRGYTKLYVCNYGPGGNLVGGSMYKIGFPGMTSCEKFGNMQQSERYVGLCEVDSLRYVDHMCQDVGAPPLVETPPDHHKPTQLPPQSIFHEMMGDNALSDLAMHSSHLFMKGVKHTMDFANLLNPFQWGEKLTRPFRDFMN